MAISPNTSPLCPPAWPLEPQMTHITWLVTLAAAGLLCSPFTARWSSGSHSYPTTHSTRLLLSQQPSSCLPSNPSSAVVHTGTGHFRLYNLLKGCPSLRGVLNQEF